MYPAIDMLCVVGKRSGVSAVMLLLLTQRLAFGRHDTANKLIIIANAILRVPTRTSDVSVTGIRDVTQAMLADADKVGEVFKLVAEARCDAPGKYTLTVQPKRVPRHSFLGGLCGWEMGLVFTSDLFEVVSMKIDEPSVVPTSSAVLRDVLHCALRSARGAPMAASP